MRILSVHNYHYIGGGADRTFLQTNELLRERGHQVIPFSVADGRNIPSEYSSYFLSDIESSNFLVKSLKRVERTFYSLEARRKLAQLIDDHPSDIAHLHNIYGRISPSILDVLNARGIPVVQTLHDYKLICPVHSLLSREGRVCEDCQPTRYYKCFLNNCSPYSFSLLKSGLHALEMYFHHFMLSYQERIDRFIAPSLFLRSKMSQFGVDEEKIIHIPIFVRIDEFTPIYQAENYIAFFGMVSHLKGLDILIEAMKDVPHTPLLVIGSGPQLHDCMRQAERLALDNVRFLGFKRGEELRRLVARAMFSVLPSRWYENNPAAVLESFASATPVIASNTGGIPELIENGRDGLLCEPNSVKDLHNKIVYLLKHKGQVGEMGRRARWKVEEYYNAETYYEKLMAVYRELS